MLTITLATYFISFRNTFCWCHFSKPQILFLYSNINIIPQMCALIIFLLFFCVLYFGRQAIKLKEKQSHCLLSCLDTKKEKEKENIWIKGYSQFLAFNILIFSALVIKRLSVTSHIQTTFCFLLNSIRVKTNLFFSGLLCGYYVFDIVQKFVFYFLLFLSLMFCSIDWTWTEHTSKILKKKKYFYSDFNCFQCLQL